MIKSMIIAFSMYSIIPMPHVEWDDKSMKHAFLFFPFVGAFIGCVCYFFFSIIENSIMRACVLSVIPLLVTGGIHMDGFMDTIDALFSNKDVKQRLEIMKDPHVGAFAVIYCVIYMILTVGFYSQVNEARIFVVIFGFCFSRVLSAIAVIKFPKAKNTGLAALWSKSSDNSMYYMLILEAVLFSLLMVLSDFRGGIQAVIMSGIVFIYHHYNSMKNFGGITGDLAGYFLQILELMILLFGGVL